MIKDKITVAVLLVCAAMLLGGCGQSSSSSFYEESTSAMGAYENAKSAEFAEESAYDSADVTADNSAASDVAAQTNRKLITTMNLDVETDDLDKTSSDIESKVTSLGGYIESSTVNNETEYRGNRNSYYTIRIPADKLDGFIESIEGSTNILSKSVNVQDVTLEYVDTESRKTALITEEKRLLEILEEAESVEDIIKIEERLSDVRYEKESIESRLRSYDNLVDYSTVYLSITEVIEYTPVEEQSAFTRMGEGFVKSCKTVVTTIKEIIIWLVVNLPHLIVFGLFVAIIVFVVLKIDKASKKKKDQKKQQNQQKQQNVAENEGNNGNKQ